MHYLYKRLTPEALEVMHVSRETAVAYSHGYIHIDHLFLAMLKSPCMARPYLETIDVIRWGHLIQEGHPVNDTVDATTTLPFTLATERVLIHADTFAFSRQQALISSVDILMAILAYENPITIVISKTGIILEKLLKLHYGPDVVWTPLEIKDYKPVSRLRWLFKPSADRQRFRQRLINNIQVLDAYRLYEKMILLADVILKNEPENTDALYYKGLAYYRKRQFEQATPIITGLSHLSSFEEKCHLILADIAAKQGNPTLVIQAMERAIEKEQNNWKTLNILGYYLSIQQMYEEAKPYLERAIAISPEEAYPYCNLGFVLYKQGEIRKGIDMIHHSITLDKSNAYAYKVLGDIAMDNGEHDKAKRSFQEALDYLYTRKYGNDVLEKLVQLQ